MEILNVYPNYLTAALPKQRQASFNLSVYCKARASLHKRVPLTPWPFSSLNLPARICVILWNISNA